MSKKQPIEPRESRKATIIELGSIEPSNRTQPWNLNSFYTHLKKLELDDINITSQDLWQLVLEIDSKIPPEITKDDLYNLAIMLANDRVSLEQPKWSFLAARLFLKKIYSEYHRNLTRGFGSVHIAGKNSCELLRYLKYGIKIGRLCPSILRRYSSRAIKLMDRAIDTTYDLQFNYLSVKTIYDKYLLRDGEGLLIETPQLMFAGISLFLNQDVERSDLDDIKSAITGYKMLAELKAMVATPLLTNARTPRRQLNSCYVGSTDDDLRCIMDSYSDMAHISKGGGGIGWDFTKIRGVGSSIGTTKACAGGLVPFLKVANDIAIAVDQVGVRKGAIAVWCEVWHQEIQEFIELRKNSGEERRRALDLFPGLWIPDLFMKRVKANSSWSLFNPQDVGDLSSLWGEAFEKEYIRLELDESVPRVTIKAKDLWKRIMISLHETGLPFLGFKDTANRSNMLKDQGVIRSSNLCTEIFQNTSPSTYKYKITRRVRHIKEQTAILNGDDLVEVLGKGDVPASRVYIGDRVKFKHTKKTIYYEVADVSKVPGDVAEVAVCTLGSVNLAKVNRYQDFQNTIPTLVKMLNAAIDLNNYPIDSARATQKRTRSIGVGVMGEAEMLASQGIVYGSDEHKQLINEVFEAFSYSVYNAGYCFTESDSTQGKSEWVQGILPMDHNENYAENIKTELKSKFPKARWDNLRSVWENSNKGPSGYMIAIAPTSSISLVVGTTPGIEPIYSPIWSEENKSGLITSVVPNYSAETAPFYKTAYEVDQKDLIELAAIRQHWVDQGISLNLFISPKNSRLSYLSELYMYAWELGLKSTYYCRTFSPEISDGKSCNISNPECESCQ